MAQRVERLSALAVSRAKSAGMYADGGGLYLQVSSSGTKSWIFRFALNGREREMELGPLPDVSLAEAREKASICRRLKRDGFDPIETRKAERRQAQLDAAKAITFKTPQRPILNHTRQEGETPSTPTNGAARSRFMLILCSVRSPCKAST
jgi:hypothetical protein